MLFFLFPHNLQTPAAQPDPGPGCPCYQTSCPLLSQARIPCLLGKRSSLVRAPPIGSLTEYNPEASNNSLKSISVGP